MADELTQISIPNFPFDLKEKLEREAERQDRSLASLLRKVITEYADSLAKEPAQRKTRTASETVAA